MELAGIWDSRLQVSISRGEPKPRNISYHVIISFASLVLALVWNTKWKVLRQFVLLFPPHPHIRSLQITAKMAFGKLYTCEVSADASWPSMSS